jgi:CarD family transcriptional regulator
MASQKQTTAFAKGDRVVYPAHGVGLVADVVEQEVAGFKLELLVIEIPRSKMVLRIPRAKVASSGLRPVMSKAQAEDVLSALEGRARRSKALWSRRAQDYEGKINSGDPLALAEVVRDLSRAADDAASYSEKTIHEAAVERLAAELACALDVTETEAGRRIEQHLAKRPSRAGQEPDGEAEAAAA